jgi:hypothetical protein
MPTAAPNALPTFIGMHREQDYFHLRHRLFQNDRSFRTVHYRHGEIEQNQIRLKSFCLFYCFRAVPRFTANREGRLAFHKHPEQITGGWIVINY